MAGEFSAADAGSQVRVVGWVHRRRDLGGLVFFELRDRSGRLQLSLGPGTLYGAIKRLLAKGLIEEADERPDPELNEERRRYYRLTEFGLRVVSAEAVRLAGLVRQAQAKQLLPGPTPNPVEGSA